MTGTGIGQVVALLLSPIVTRLFDPEHFTTLEQIAMLIAVCAVFSTGKYEFAIVQEKEKENARHLVILALRIAGVVFAILLPLSWLLGDQVASWYDNPELSTWLWLFPLGLFFFSIQNTLNYWFTRQKKFKTAAGSKIAFSLVNEPAKIATGSLGWLSGGLVISVVFGRMVSAGYLLWKFLKDETAGLGGTIKGRVGEVARQYSEYPRYTVLGSLLGRLAQWAHIFMFSYYFGVWAIGFFALSRRVFMNPLNILSTSYAQVFYQRISEIEDPEKLRKFYFSNLFRFSLLSAILVITVHIIPDNTMGFIFGEKWTATIDFLRLLSFWFALNFITGSLSFINYRLKKQKAMFLLDALHFVLVVGSILFAVKNGWSEMETVFALVVAKVVFFSLNIFASIFFVLQYSNRLSK